MRRDGLFDRSRPIDTSTLGRIAIGSPRPRLVILESPYAGDVLHNVAYARAAVRDSLQRGEAPIASHLLYTQEGILDDAIAAERALGIAAGLAWRQVAEAAVFYVDLGFSGGMLAARDAYERDGVRFEFRCLPFAAWAAVAPSERS